MEPQQQPPNEDSGSSKGSSFLCRQSSTRWTPTTDQIRILKDLYYNNGVRSPSAEQIQRISARLRQYGKIEGKNVFYWFQNHKARERQKKRFTTTTDLHMQRGVASSSSPSPGVVAVGQMGGFGYGAVNMEKNFRDCSISAGGGDGVGGSISHNFGWVGIDPYSTPYTLYDKRKSIDDTLEEEAEEEEEAPEIETLPLFPMHGEEINGFYNIKPQSDGYYTGWYRSDNGNGSSRTSLELSLNSYTGGSPHSN
ncbi:hypothetical protein L1049_023879 [Liquidambar formosana]|uniref:Homeobox domain-containing protein n=1 Tax=Liquidambar formosana TaxID=63359 RepID=A0AAP0RTK1_LIQFO